jgi:thiol-disulfide isomerase/thioredoxin
MPFFHLSGFYHAAGIERYNIFMQMNRPAPDFELPDLESKMHRLSDYRGRIIIVNFWSRECPHSERADGLILGWLKEWNGEVELLSIASNRNESAQSVERASRARSLPTVLTDAQTVVADLYKAVTTPHVFVVDKGGILRYRGAVDDVTFRNRKATRFYLKEAVESLLDGRLPGLTDTPAYGCTIVREI